MFVLMLLTACSTNKQVAQTNESSAQTKEIDFEASAKEVVMNENTVTFTDASGKKVTLNKNPKKVVGLYNSYTKLWYQAGGTIVGRIDSTSELPKEALDKAIQTVGSMTTVNVESLISLKPDLVILRNDKQSELIPQLEQNKIAYISMEYDSFKDYLKYLKIFTALTGHEALYKTDGLEVLARINETVKKVPNENNPNVLLMFATTSSVKAYLPNTATGEMLSQLKAVNIAQSWETTKATSIELNIEYLSSNNPDYILVQCMSSVEEVKAYIDKTYGTQQWWQALDAVKKDRVIYLDRDLFHYKPNNQYDKAYLKLGEILYPEVY
jgi:iron complex transport system substrate-binding protein